MAGENFYKYRAGYNQSDKTILNMKKITKREVAIFLLGMFTFFIVESICDWDNSVKDFKKGFQIGLSTK